MCHPPSSKPNYAVGDEVLVKGIVKHIGECGSAGIKIKQPGGYAIVVVQPPQIVVPDKRSFKIGDRVQDSITNLGGVVLAIDDESAWVKTESGSNITVPFTALVVTKG